MFNRQNCWHFGYFWESTAGYMYIYITPCVGSFACPGTDTQVPYNKPHSKDEVGFLLAQLA
jgi:hypothetical protein